MVTYWTGWLGFEKPDWDENWYQLFVFTVYFRLLTVRFMLFLHPFSLRPFSFDKITKEIKIFTTDSFTSINKRPGESGRSLLTTKRMVLKHKWTLKAIQSARWYKNYGSKVGDCEQTWTVVVPRGRSACADISTE